MVKITLEFKGVDEAIVALGKLVGAPVATAASSPVGAEKPAASTTRKPRADVGKKRGSYKNVEAPAAPVEGDKPQPPGVTPPVASTPETAAPEKTVTPAGAGASAGDARTVGREQTPPPAAAAPSEAEAQAALEAVFTGKGLPAAQTLLAKFEVTRLRDLPAEKRAAFIEAAKEVK